MRLRVGTLGAILRDVAKHLDVSRQTLQEALFEKQACSRMQYPPMRTAIPAKSADVDSSSTANGDDTSWGVSSYQEMSPQRGRAATRPGRSG